MGCTFRYRACSSPGVHKSVSSPIFNLGNKCHITTGSSTYGTFQNCCLHVSYYVLLVQMKSHIYCSLVCHSPVSNPVIKEDHLIVVTEHFPLQAFLTMRKGSSIPVSMSPVELGARHNLGKYGVDVCCASLHHRI